MKKIFSLLLFLFIVFLLNFTEISHANSTPWNQEKAEHLARRVLIGVDQQTVETLFNAGTSNAAVNLLFPDVNGPDRTSFNSIISDLTSDPNFSFTKSSDMIKLYHLNYVYDPYESKRKLFSIFEDIFSSNVGSNGITYKDINDTHNLIYSETLGNYKDLIKKILFNDGNPGDFTEGRYLDLFNQNNKKYPNENYARELLQLFLMDEYKPLETMDNGDIRNYEETDVASLSKILFGYEFDDTSSDHIVSYNPPVYSGNDTRYVEFLTGSLKSGDSFSFYNTASGTIDLEQIQSGGGVSLRNNIVDYIFSKREEEISLFLANKLFRFYVHENPTVNNLNDFSQEIRNNNFEILPSIKWLLSSDYMYTNESIHELRYKNPIELAGGTIKILNQNNKTYIDPTVYYTNIFSNIGWSPYRQGSIFGRAGFDNNTNFYNANLQNKWISYIPKFAYNSSSKISTVYNLLPYTSTGVIGQYNLGEVDSSILDGHLIYGTGVINYSSGSTVFSDNFENLKYDFINKKIILNFGESIFENKSMTGSLFDISYFSSGSFIKDSDNYSLIDITFTETNSGVIERSLSVDEIISIFEKKLSLGKSIDIDTKNKIINFGNTDEFGETTFFDSKNNEEKIESIGTIIMSLPEYVLNSGFNSTTSSTNESSFLNSTDSKIIFVNLAGGYDYLYNFFPKDNKLELETLRPTLHREDSEIVSLDDEFYMENNIAYGSGGTNGLKYLFDNDYLRVFNRTGAKNHSRAHDQASKAVQSCDSFTVNDVDGSFGKFIKEEVPSNTMVIGNSKPYVFRNGRYINIGSSGNILNNEKLSTNKRQVMLDVIRDIGENSDFPGDTSRTFKDAIIIDSIGTTAKIDTNRDGVGYGNEQNYNFIKSMLNNGYGKAFFLRGDGGYDTHNNQVLSLDKNINKVITSMVGFFDEVKNTQDLTIILYSEFGRTIKENGGSGTDHGKGGVMWVLTTNQKLKNMLPQKIYGELDVTKEKENLLGVGIYYDSVYSKIIEALYNKTGIYTHELETDILTDTPKVSKLNTVLKPVGNRIYTEVAFEIESDNFDITSASNLKIKYGPRLDNLNRDISSWEIYRKSNSILNGKKAKFSKYLSGTGFAFNVNVMNNQYAENIFSDIEFISPEKMNALEIFEYEDTLLSSFSNKLVSGNEILSSPILLGQTTGTGELEKVLSKGNGISLILGTGSTYIDELYGSGQWYGRFVLGDFIDKDLFLPSNALTSSGELMHNLSIDKIVKIGPDTLGVGMNLDREITVKIGNLQTDIVYKIFTSTDGDNWNYLTGSTSSSSGVLLFPTNHFSYFSLISNEPLDSTPDSFSFTNIAGGELNNEYISNSIIVSGINTQTSISIDSGEYSINDGPFSSSLGIVNNGDKVTLRLTSSSSYSNAVISNLVIGGVSGKFSITTKSKPSSGGGGGGGRSKDFCPNGDFTSSMYDDECGENPGGGIDDEPIDEETKEEDNNQDKDILENVGKISLVNYKGFQIMQIGGYSKNLNIARMTVGVISNENLSAQDKEKIILRINEYFKAEFNYSNGGGNTVVLKNKLTKQLILLQLVLKNINLKNTIVDISKNNEGGNEEDSGNNAKKPIVNPEKNSDVNIDKINIPKEDNTKQIHEITEPAINRNKGDTYKYSFRGYEIIQIEGYKSNDTIKKIAKILINKRGISIKDKEQLILRLNTFFEAYYIYSQDKSIVNKKKFTKQLILLKSLIRKALK